MVKAMTIAELIKELEKVPDGKRDLLGSYSRKNGNKGVGKAPYSCYNELIIKEGSGRHG